MRVFALFVLAAACAAGGDWSSLGKVPNNKKLTIQLLTGRRLTGTIRQVGPESLQFVPNARHIRLNVGELGQHVDSAQVGTVVQLATSSGLALTGRLRGVEEGSISVEHNETVEISRKAIRRVFSRAHGLGALVGLGMGAGGAAALGAAEKPTKKERGRGANAIEAASFFGPMGAIAGAIIGVGRTYYDAALPGPAGRP